MDFIHFRMLYQKLEIVSSLFCLFNLSKSVGIIFFWTAMVYAFCISLSAFSMLFEVVILISLTGRCWVFRNSPY